MTRIYADPYTVIGTFPFPLDMLRRDDSQAATPEDQAKIDRLSQDHAPDDLDFRTPVAITLVKRTADRYEPNYQRWKSFGWTVQGHSQYQLELAQRNRAALRESGLAKLTAEERAALDL